VEECGLPLLLLDLSVSDSFALRTHALSILANLTSSILGILRKLPSDQLSIAIATNVSATFFKGRRYVFLWLANILKSSPDFFPFLTLSVPLTALYDSALEHIIFEPDPFISLFFCELSCVGGISPDLLKCISDFFYFYMAREHPNPDSFVLLGIHSLLEDEAIPAHAKNEMCDSLQLLRAIRYLIDRPPSRTVFLAFTILADLVELGLCEFGPAAEPLLTAVAAVDGSDDCELYLYDALLRILSQSETDFVIHAWRWNDGLLLESLLNAFSWAQFGPKKLAMKCLWVLIDALPTEELRVLLREDVFEAVLSAAEDHPERAADAFDRILDCVDSPAARADFRRAFGAVEDADRLPAVADKITAVFEMA
jgi:hypothetical protein